jgi:hypothetical protein
LPIDQHFDDVQFAKLADAVEPTYSGSRVSLLAAFDDPGSGSGSWRSRSAEVASSRSTWEIRATPPDDARDLRSIAAQDSRW